MSEEEYWQECISEAFEEAGLEATESQINSVARFVQDVSGTENMAFPPPCTKGETLEELEVKKLQADLERERNKKVCKACNGSGWVPCGSSHNASCTSCDGTGWIYH